MALTASAGLPSSGMLKASTDASPSCLARSPMLAMGVPSAPSISLKRLSREQWAWLAEHAHLVSFGEHKPREWDRIDFAVLLVDETDTAQAWATCRELDAHTLYLQFGGALPEARGTPKSWECFRILLAWARQSYQRVTFLVENSNLPMLKMGMKAGFRIVGVRNYKGSILLEHLLEFEGG